MRYFGSKAMTATAVQARASRLLGKTVHGATVCDPFGGMGMIASSFRSAGWRVHVSDHLLFPHYYQRARLTSTPSFSHLLSHLRLKTPSDVQSLLQNAPGQSGWFSQAYAKERAYFTLGNAGKIEAIWRIILRWRRAGLLDEQEYAFLIASLVDSFDRVANTAGTYYAYLRKMTRRALHNLELRFLIPTTGSFDAICQQRDALTAVTAQHFDVLYLDPPYSARVYDRYYHLPGTIAKGMPAIATGTSGVPTRPPQKSKFESPKTAERAFCELVDAARCSILMVQYAEGGLISLDRIRDILSATGKVRETQLDTIGYTTRAQSRRTHHSLFTVSRA